MSYRNLFIQNPARLSTKNEQLVVCTQEEIFIPIEDINCLLLESRQISVNTHTLSKLAQSGVLVLLCDERHMPCSFLLPTGQYCRRLKILGAQINQPRPKIKRLWQQTVASKILNQARCLKICEKKEAARLEQLAQTVRSGDPENVEGTAAACYFRALFGPAFFRGEEGLVNSALNYGYAILRGAVARSLSVYGFEPALGIHHHNELNSFNLADDLMEPFRPVVDLFVATNVDNSPNGALTPALKHSLFHLLNADINSDGQHHTVAYAIERLIHSLNRCLLENQERLALPKLIELRQHQYE
jgi:CRISPR-associated protein Cas1